MKFQKVRATCIPLLGILLLASMSLAQESSTSKARDQFVGAWRLVSVETVRQNGEVIYPFYGQHPQGLLVYAASGWMSVQIVSDPMPTVPSADSREGFLKAPVDQKAKAIDGFYSYYGTWSVDSSKATVTHHIEQSLYPAERGEAGIRHFAIEGDYLTLTAKTHEMGEEHERKLVWHGESTGPHD